MKSIKLKGVVGLIENRKDDKSGNIRYYSIIDKGNKWITLAMISSELKNLQVLKLYKKGFPPLQKLGTQEVKINENVFISGRLGSDILDKEIIKTKLPEVAILNLINLIEQVKIEQKQIPDKSMIKNAYIDENILSTAPYFIEAINDGRINTTNVDLASVNYSELIKIPLTSFKNKFEVLYNQSLKEGKNVEIEFQKLFNGDGFNSNWLFSLISGNNVSTYKMGKATNFGDYENNDTNIKNKGRAKGSRYTDFELVSEYGIILIEMKDPKSKIYSYDVDGLVIGGGRNNFRFSPEFLDVINQVITEIQDKTIYLLSKEEKSKRTFVKGLVIYGDLSEITNYSDHEISKDMMMQLNRYINSLYNIELKTYDQLNDSLETISGNDSIFVK